MLDISNSVLITFSLTTIATLYFFYKAFSNKKVLITIIIYTIIVSVLGLNGFYRKENTFPPRFILLLLPALIIIASVFITKQGKVFIDSLKLKWLTLLHIIRIPIEIILYYVFLEGFIPDLMTYEGYNYDIISGLSAPVIYYLFFVKKQIHYNAFLIWNFICLILLINIVTIAILSAQTPFQKLAFNQPNIGVTYFPLVWLPSLIVPIVLFSHLVSIRHILKLKKQKTACY